MRLDAEFIKLPYHFDVEKLKSEVLSLDEADWIPHPSGFAGNASIPLISVRGEMNDAFHGPMQTTHFLPKLPYIQQVLASFGEVFGRSRLMSLAGSCEVPAHVDTNYHWHNRVRIHIPIITNPQVIFYCGDQQVHMAGGETWIFDSWKNHRVHNQSDETRVHLVIDTAGSARFWELVKSSAHNPQKSEAGNRQAEEIRIPYEPDKKVRILTERYNYPLVMTPGEVDYLILDLLDDMSANEANEPGVVLRFTQAAHQFRQNWRIAWSLYGDQREGWDRYNALIGQASGAMKSLTKELKLKSNGASAFLAFRDRVLGSVLNPNLERHYKFPSQS